MNQARYYVTRVPVWLQRAGAHDTDARPHDELLEDNPTQSLTRCLVQPGEALEFIMESHHYMIVRRPDGTELLIEKSDSLLQEQPN